MEVSNMMKKLMSLGLAGILSASLLVGCSSNNDSKDDDTVTIKYVDENGNVKREKVTKDEAKQIERKQQTTDTDKKEQTTKEQPKDEDDMTDDEMQEKGLIKKNGGHLEDEAKKQEKIHEQEDREQQEQQGKYPICYDEDGTQINDEYGNYTPEYEQKKQEEWNRHENYDDDEDYPNKDVHDSCIDPEDTTNTDNDVEESPSETIENN
jgi:outer membrane biosynthesis protein TonB